MQDVDTDKKGSIEILFDTMQDEPVANAEFTLYQVAAMVDRGGYTVLELTGGFEGSNVQLKNLTAQQSKEASAALLEYRKANHISGDTKKTDANGKLSWTGLQTGLYLLVPGQMQKYRTDPSLISIPTNLNAQRHRHVGESQGRKDSGSGISAGRIRGAHYAGGKTAEKDRDHRYTPNHSGAENTGEAAPDRTAALADSGTFRSRSRIAVSWMVDRSKKKTVPRNLMGLGIVLAAGAVGISAYNIWDSSRAEAAVEASLEAYEEELAAVEQESEALPVDENSGMTFVEADGLCWIGELEIPSLRLTLPVANPWSYPS